MNWSAIRAIVAKDLRAFTRDRFYLFMTVLGLVDLSINGATFADVAPQLAIAAAICLALVPIVTRFGRSLEGRLVGEAKHQPVLTTA